MKKSITKKQFAVLTTIVFGLALAGCSNPFLQLGSEAVSQAAAPGIVSAMAAPEPRMMNVKFNIPGTSTAFYTQKLPLGGEIDWYAVYEKYAEYAENVDSSFLDPYGYWFTGNVVEEWKDTAAASVFSGSIPEIDVRNETNDGEIELCLEPKMRPQYVVIKWVWLRVGGPILPLVDVGIAFNSEKYTFWIYGYKDKLGIDIDNPFEVWDYTEKNLITTFDPMHPEELLLDQYYENGLVIRVPCYN